MTFAICWLLIFCHPIATILFNRFDRWMQEYAKKFGDVTLANNTDHVTAISLSGPKSRDLLQSLTETDMSNASFKFMDNRRILINGIPVLALRVAYTGM